MHPCNSSRGRACRAIVVGLLGIALLASTVTVAAPPTAFADTTFTITGRGWGHGIGLSQWGAQGYAKNHSWEYRKILGHYFQQTSIAAASALTVKVNLDKDARARASWRIRSGTPGRPLTIIDQSTPADRTTLETDAPYWITVSRGNVRVQTDITDRDGKPAPGTIVKTFSGAAYATTGGSSYLIQILSVSGPFSGNNIRWRGNLAFVPSGTSASTAVNHVGMEQYLYGVVPRESPASFEPEALKAQAVAARSYAYTSAVGGRTLYCTVKSQVYNGHSRNSNSHEDPRTNQAVDETRGEVVMYGSEVVRTFYSSSSGGHTANVEDVWVSSEPKPYYTGVPDADGPYPNGISWASSIKLTGSELATRIRTYDFGNNGLYDYSSRVPATVLSATIERAPSGFARYIQFRWSDGKTYRIRGTTFQSVLNLKSSKYYLGAEYPPPLVTRRYQEGDARIAYAGAWKTSASSVLLGGTQAYSDSAGASCTVSFTGTGLRWYGNRAPAYGRANVYVDGSYDRTIDLYSSTAKYGQALWAVGGLSLDQTHTVTVRVLGDRNASSRGSAVAIDAFDVFDGVLVKTPQPIVRAEETDARIAIAGGWQSGENAALSGGSHIYTDRAARAVIAFVGRGVTWIGSKSPQYGTARVSLDGGPAQTIDLYAALSGYQQPLWSKQGLPFGPHVLTIEATGQKSSASDGSFVSLDAVDITGGTLTTATLPAVRVEDGSSSIAWTGVWNTGKNSVLSSGAQHWSATRHANATLNFSGTGVRWIASRAPSYGKAAVILDGVQVAVIDLYAARPAYRQVAYGVSGLASGPHTLTIRVLGTSRAGAKGKNVSVDAFDVNGVATAAR